MTRHLEIGVIEGDRSQEHIAPKTLEREDVELIGSKWVHSRSRIEKWAEIHDDDAVYNYMIKYYPYNNQSPLDDEDYINLTTHKSKMALKWLGFWNIGQEWLRFDY